MPLSAPRYPHVRYHPGSSEQEIADEPEWTGQHDHRIGFLNRQNRVAGLTHDGDHDIYEAEEDRRFADDAIRRDQQLKDRTGRGELLNFEDIARGETDYRQHRPDAYPPGFRSVIHAREDWIKKEQNWPANIKQRERAKAQQDQLQVNGDTTKNEKAQAETGKDDQNAEHDWRRNEGGSSVKHHDAYGQSDVGKDLKPDQSKEDLEYQALRETYSPEEITLLRHIQHESEQTKAFRQNDGQGESPLKQQKLHHSIAIDAIDAMTPDNWIPRSSDLIRNTGQHPLNAEPRLEVLFSAGLITPNHLHYVRNHASVPRLYWDTHVLDVCDGALRLSMDDLKNGFHSFNIPVALACDGNRRGELNLIKKSKGFSWGPGAISCAYWKGAMLYDVLAAAGVDQPKWNGRRKWINFEGADNPSEGKYATSIPLDDALDPANDVMLAYGMNDAPLPADHGFPVRLLIPGFVGGRCVKWLARIWITDNENESFYHIWDNRVLPAFITEKDGEFARTMFSHPSTACNEQNLNSVIVRPGQGDTIDVADLLKKSTYRVEGFAYDGGGHEVQRVELSLDNGATWLYCIRRFTDRPIRNGRRFWAWIHWYIDIDSAYMAKAESLIVRCFNVFKNTQPQYGSWNLMGMMNNGWYIVKPEMQKGGKLLFRHPYDQERNGEGWMKPSVENQLAAMKQNSGVPDKQFTRQEIESHNSKEDAWLVVNGNVYDVTSVLAWHPGGTATILANSGKLSLEVTSSFESIHDDYAHKKLQECVIGRVTDKAANFMKEQAKVDAEKALKEGQNNKLFLQSKKWIPVTLVKKDQLSHDTFAYTFSYRDENSPKDLKLGLGTCQHIQFGIHMLDKMLIRSYTPTRPITTDTDDGTFELTVKTYFPDTNQPGGAFSTFLHELPLGHRIEACGPTGEIEYLGQGKFDIEGEQRTFRRINMVLGGSGVTPGFSLLQRVALDQDDSETEIRVVDANKSEADILLREKLIQIEKDSGGRIKITHVVSKPDDKAAWEQAGGFVGHVNADIIRKSLFAPSAKDAADGVPQKSGVVTFLCGPPPMIQKAALPALRDWGFVEDEDCYGF